MKNLRKLLDGEGLKYFLSPDQDMVMMPMGGINGHYTVAIPLELEGRFLQFRTVMYLSCPVDHPHLPEVLKVLAALNYQLRLTKFGWDASDGEIVAYADLWLEDGGLTQKQLHAMLTCYMPALDINFPRISKTIESGQDPGEVSPEDLIAGLDPKLRDVLDELRDKKAKDGGEKKADFGEV